MVKGTTRQVIVVKGADTTLFDQAIFLVRDEAVSNGGVTEEKLLQEARAACKQSTVSGRSHKLLWSVLGASFTGLLWLISLLL